VMRRRLQGTAPYESTTISGYSNSTEQSENVYENKGTVQKSTTPGSSLSKEGNCKLPSSDEEGRGRWDFVSQPSTLDSQLSPA
jgi:hypothetical protein